MSGVQNIVQLSLVKPSIAAWEQLCFDCLLTANLRRCLFKQVYFTQLQLQITSIHDQTQPISSMSFHSKFDKQLKQDAPVRQHSAQSPGKPSGA